MPARTDAEKLAKIREYCGMLIAMADDDPPAGMTDSEKVYWEAIQNGYHMATTTITNIIDHGSARYGATKPKDS